MLIEEQHAIATTINEQHREVSTRADQAIAIALEIGQQLKDIHDTTGISFPAWVEEHCEFGISMAYRYLRAHQFRDRISLSAPENLTQLLDMASEASRQSHEERHAMAIEMLRNGASQIKVAKDLKMSVQVIRQLYEEKALQFLLEVDWPKHCLEAAVPTMVAAKKYRHVILAQAKFAGIAGRDFVASKLGTKVGNWHSSLRILKHGCPQLVAHASAGHIRLSAAGTLAKKPKGEQLRAIAIDHEINLPSIDAIRMLANEFANLRREFCRRQGESVWTDIRQSDKPDDMTSIIGLLVANKEFLLTAIESLDALET